MLYVAIGQNIGDKPMSGSRWFEFQSEVANAVGDYFGEPDTIATGNSNFEGAKEWTCVMVWFAVESVRDILVDRLSVIATKYGQESIVWSVAETQFAQRIQD